jgi:hypothetical protein
LPVILIPSLDASKITTGMFAAALLPAVVGLGPTSAAGVVPNPGPVGGGALATDYLARDASWKAIPILPTSYQPALGNIVFGASTNVTGARTVTPATPETSLAPTIFYSLSSAGGSATGPFKQFNLASDATSVGYVSVPPLATVWAYSAYHGYTNSAIVSYTNPNTV